MDHPICEDDKRGAYFEDEVVTFHICPPISLG